MSRKTSHPPANQEPKPLPPAVVLRNELLNNYQGVIVAMVGKENMNRFAQNFYLALARDPDLITCDKKSLFLSCLYAAQRGLEVGVPDGVALVPFKGKVTPITQYQALIKRAIESGVIDSGRPVLVYKNDVFHYEEGSERRIMHVPTGLNEDPGEVIGGYFTYEIGDKTYFAPPLRLSDFHKARAASAAWKAKESGPWADWFEAMCAKTVVHRAFKLLPLPSSLKQLVEDEGKVLAEGDLAGVLDPDIIDLPVSDVSPVTTPQGEPIKAGRGATLADKLKDHPNNTPPPGAEPPPELPPEAEAFFVSSPEASQTSVPISPGGPEDLTSAQLFPEGEAPGQQPSDSEMVREIVAEIKAAAEARQVPFPLLGRKYDVASWDDMLKLSPDQLTLILDYVKKIRPPKK